MIRIVSKTLGSLRKKDDPAIGIKPTQEVTTVHRSAVVSSDSSGYGSLRRPKAPNPLDEGLDILKQAIDLDAADDFDQAFPLYLKGLEVTVPLLKGIEDVHRRNTLREQIVFCMERSEQLKLLIQLPKPASNSAVSDAPIFPSVPTDVGTPITHDEFPEFPSIPTTTSRTSSFDFPTFPTIPSNTSSTSTNPSIAPSTSTIPNPTFPEFPSFPTFPSTPSMPSIPSTFPSLPSTNMPSIPSNLPSTIPSVPSPTQDLTFPQIPTMPDFGTKKFKFSKSSNIRLPSFKR
eukprot:TRINITY_DN6602_c0_g1_i7.p1 TRINITY_DN6602_c0_g1~~TRINITY_DN6602_c0_g1_i7.p1  ORF type:complete len:288 (+),score=54.05 TRINITY_DN6602_c0_g1_i7:75-938(+)